MAKQNLAVLAGLCRYNEPGVNRLASLTSANKELPLIESSSERLSTTWQRCDNRRFPSINSKRILDSTESAGDIHRARRPVRLSFMLILEPVIIARSTAHTWTILDSITSCGLVSCLYKFPRVTSRIFKDFSSKLKTQLPLRKPEQQSFDTSKPGRRRLTSSHGLRRLARKHTSSTRYEMADVQVHDDAYLATG